MYSMNCVFAILVLLFACTVRAKISCSQCDHVIQPAGGTYTIVDNDNLNLKPGSKICYKAGVNYNTGHHIYNLQGTAAKPFIITNCDGPAKIQTSSHGIMLRRSKFVRITGTGWAPAKKYGLEITDTGFGIALVEGTTHVEVDHVYIHDNVGHACITAKSDPDSSEWYRSNFVMKKVFLHDNKLINCATEGFYVGYFNYELVLSDGGRPHEIIDAKVYNNYVQNSGWDSIQLGCTTAGAEIFGNEVINYATEGKLYQNSGIFCNPGFRGKIYSNFVKASNAGGNGIQYHGNGNTDIYNNVVISGGYGISLSVSSFRTNPGSYHKVDHNTVIAGGTRGVNMVTNFATNTANNNVIVYGGSASWECHNGGSGDNICSDNGIQSAWGFKNVGNDNYELTASSSLIGTASNGIRNRDFKYKTRTGSQDYGAYEYKPGSKNLNNPTKYTLVKPAKTKGVKTTSVERKKIQFKWTPLHHYVIQKYEIKYKKKGGSWKTKSTGNTNYKLTGLKADTTYIIRVRGVNYAGNGSWSKDLEVDTEP